MAETAFKSQLVDEHFQQNLSAEDRQWLENNLAHFDELLRLNYGKSVEDFAEVVLEEIGETLNILRGVFYLLDEELKLVYATSGYACNTAHLAHAQFKIGDGLVGQAARTGKALYFGHLPKRDAVIATGLAKLSARSFLVLPLEFNGQVFGVIELGHMRNFSPLELRFTEILSRNIASTLQSLLNNDRNRSLLEEMRAQEEEMRQNNEELTAAQEEMSRRQQELERKDEFFRTLTNNVPGIIYQFTMESPEKFYFSFVSGGIRHLLGYENVEEFNHALSTEGFIYPDDAPAFQENLVHAYSNMERFEWEGRLMSSNGSYRWVKATSVPNLQGNNTVVFSGFMEDIAERKRAEEQVATRNQMMESAMKKARQREQELKSTLAEKEQELENLRAQTN